MLSSRCEQTQRAHIKEEAGGAGGGLADNQGVDPNLGFLHSYRIMGTSYDRSETL